MARCRQACGDPSSQSDSCASPLYASPPTGEKPPPYHNSNDDDNHKESCEYRGLSNATPADGDTWELKLFVFPVGRPKEEGRGLSGLEDLRVGIEVVTKDMPRLTKDGFFWSEANLQPHKNYYCWQQARNSSGGSLGSYWVRVLPMADLGNDPLWTAEIMVWGRSGAEGETDQAVRNFSISDLSVDNIDWALAFQKNSTQEGVGRVVYRFEDDASEHNFNAIYGSMPMDGWWPWPRRGAS